MILTSLRAGHALTKSFGREFSWYVPVPLSTTFQLEPSAHTILYAPESSAKALSKSRALKNYSTIRRERHNAPVMLSLDRAKPFVIATSLVFVAMLKTRRLTPPDQATTLILR